MDRANLERMPPPGVRNRPVESSDLAPVMAPDTSGLPLDLWRGLEMADIERLLAGLDLPPRSPALHQLWRRMLLSSASPPAGAPSADHFMALRLEALYRSGLLGDMAEVGRDAAPGPLARVVLARKDIGLGAREAGCATIKSLARPGADLRGRLRGEAQLLIGYCAAIAGDGAAAGLAATLAREEGMADDLALRVLDSVSMGTKPHLDLPARVPLLDFRFLELLGPISQMQVLEKAEPALLVALAGAPTSDVRMRTAAAEAALRLNAMPPAAVVDVYRLQPEPSARTTPNEAADPILRRARLFRAAEVTQAPELKARLLRALLDDARTAAPAFTCRRPACWRRWWDSFGPRSKRACLPSRWWRSRRLQASTSWPAAGQRPPPRCSTGWRSSTWPILSLAVGALRGLPMWMSLPGAGASATTPCTAWQPCWMRSTSMCRWVSGRRQAARRNPHPGILPETGVLADLAQSAQRKDTGRTVLVAMRALGPNGAEGANILALGDVVRALKRAGLEPDARRLAFEALFAVWPRTPGL